MPKFKKNDLVYIKAWHGLHTEDEIGRIVSFDEKKGMYIVVHFIDLLDPSCWTWIYIKEEDIGLTSDIGGFEYYENNPQWHMNFAERRYPRLYQEIYSEEYYWSKDLNEGKITYAQFLAYMDAAYERDHPNMAALQKSRFLAEVERQKTKRDKLMRKCAERGPREPKIGDTVFFTCLPLYHQSTPTGRILAYEEGRDAFAVLLLDSISHDGSFWRWTYWKRGDVELADVLPKKRLLRVFPTIIPSFPLPEKNYRETYTEMYEMSRLMDAER